MPIGASYGSTAVETEERKRTSANDSRQRRKWGHVSDHGQCSCDRTPDEGSQQGWLTRPLASWSENWRSDQQNVRTVSRSEWVRKKHVYYNRDLRAYNLHQIGYPRQALRCAPFHTKTQSFLLYVWYCCRYLIRKQVDYIGPLEAVVTFDSFGTSHERCRRDRNPSDRSQARSQAIYEVARAHWKRWHRIKQA